MPELPEVETIKRDLERLIVNRKILAIRTNSAKQVQPSLKIVQKAIVDAKITKIGRRAKILIIFLDNGKTLTVHLKLTGRLLVRKRGAPEDNWQRIVIDLDNNKELRFADLRKFGWVRLIKNKKELKNLLAKFGPEPLSDLTLEKFKEILSKSGRPIKIVLMNQKKIAGIGNIYANEALFLAKINPCRPANKITDKETKKLFQAIEKVLKTGIRYRGASDQYYLDALGRQGAYQEHFLIYRREKKKCLECETKIKKIKLGGRGTFFCPHCQK